MCTVLVGMQMKVHHPMTKALLSVQQERNNKKINLLKCFLFLSSVLMDSNMEALQPTKANLFFLAVLLTKSTSHWGKCGLEPPVCRGSVQGFYFTHNTPVPEESKDCTLKTIFTKSVK